MWRSVSKIVLPVALATCSANYPPLPPDSGFDLHEQVYSYIDDNLTYKHDDELYGVSDFWAPCALTLLNKSGDCEDYSICAAAFMNGHIDKGYMITLTDNVSTGSAHAFFVYSVNGYWGTISNQKRELFSPKFPTLYRAIDNINKVRDADKRFRTYKVVDYTGVDIFSGNEDLEEKMTIIYKGKLQP